MTTPEDKRIEKVFKIFLKQNKHFKQTFDTVNFDVAIVFDKKDLKKFYIAVRNDFRETDIGIPNDSYVIFYLKNTNPHDSRKTSRGYINRVVQENERLLSSKK